MKPGKMPFHRYRPYPPVDLPDRTWPDRAITKAPRWCSVDLRDGNQALPKPMSVAEKLEMFRLLVAIGFKEIEVAFPAASQVEFDFVRTLIEGADIPDDVTIQVLTQAREHLIRRTFESLRGVRSAVVHVYNSTSTRQREAVFRKDQAGVTKIAVDAAALMAGLRSGMGGSAIRFEYTPESFTGTELPYALEICRAVMEVWKPSAQDRMIVNLPSTVEMSTPNLYADRIEWFTRNIGSRENVVISVHPHNDRGTAVAAAELAVMAGADRVEGALFGNGERTGNMDIVTMAMNLFSQGVDPGLDFSAIDRVCDVYSRCTRLAVHPRHPYAGELVYTAFSGSHQDAISKTLKLQGRSAAFWDVPYLPIDPADIGRSYEAIIRINSQSGKGGVAYVLETDWGLCLPKAMQPAFGRTIQQKTEAAGRELSSREIYDSFREEYLSSSGRFALKSCDVCSDDGTTFVTAAITSELGPITITGKGTGPVDAFLYGLREELGYDLEVVLFEEHALSGGADAEAIAYVGVRSGDDVVFGAGVDASISTASVRAVLCAVNALPGA